MLKLKSLDPAPHGSRTVHGGLATEEGRRLLRGFNFHKKKIPFPQLVEAVKKDGFLHLKMNLSQNRNFTLTELQLNFDTGKFRRSVHLQFPGPPQNGLITKKHLRTKKGFSDLIFIHGEGFLQGIMVIQNPV